MSRTIAPNKYNFRQHLNARNYRTNTFETVPRSLHYQGLHKKSRNLHNLEQCHEEKKHSIICAKPTTETETTKVIKKFKRLFATLDATKVPRKMDKNFVLEFCDHKCNWCDAKLNDAKALDHIVPKRHNGENTLSNYQYLCSYCHDLKNHLESEKRYQSIDKSCLMEYLMTEIKWDYKIENQEQRLVNIVWSLVSSQDYIKDRKQQMSQYFIKKWLSVTPGMASVISYALCPTTAITAAVSNKKD